jgi:putative hemolysin
MIDIKNYKDGFPQFTISKFGLPENSFLLKDPIRSWIDKFCCFPELRDLYEQSSIHTNIPDFSKKALELFQVKYDIRKGSIENIPKTGPVIFMANHPNGLVESTAYVNIVSGVRKDFRVIGNYLLGIVKILRPYLICSDPFAEKDIRSGNMDAIRESIEWLKKGCCFTTYPAGTVSYFHLGSLDIKDPEWFNTPVKSAIRSNATIIPICFAIKNSWMFQLSGLIHPRLRTIQIPREAFKLKGKTIPVGIGNPITAEELKKFPSAKEATQFVRNNVYNMMKLIKINE